MVAMSTDDMGFAADILRDHEIDMRLLLDIDDWEERADATDEEGEIDRGVEMSELDEVELLYANDAIACASGSRSRSREKEEGGELGREVRETGEIGERLEKRPKNGWTETLLTFSGQVLVAAVVLLEI
jgi:hypothetical protein